MAMVMGAGFALPMVPAHASQVALPSVDFLIFAALQN